MTQAHELDTRTFLISSDIANWPRLQFVRSGKYLPAEGPSHRGMVEVGIFFALLSGGLGILIIVTRGAVGVPTLVGAAPIGVALNALIWYCNNRLVDRDRR